MEVTKRRRVASKQEPKQKQKREDSWASLRNREEDEASWSSIPGDVFCLVAEKIEFIEDFISLCAACRSWYAFGADYHHKMKKLDSKFKTPFYMFGLDPYHDPYPHESRCFYPNPKRSPNLTFRSYASKRSFVINSPEASGRRCWGSPFGWLVTYGAVDLQFSLVNPFTRATIALPSMSTLFPEGFVYYPSAYFIKAFLTSDPLKSPDDCLVLVVARANTISAKYKLAFAKPGRDNAWSLISSQSGVVSQPGWSDLGDIVSFKGKLYGVSRTIYPNVFVVLIQIKPFPQVLNLLNTRLTVGDPSLGLAGRDRRIDYQYPGSRNFCFTRKHLVDLNGELCLVLRYIVKESSDGDGTCYFKIFNIDLSQRKLTRVWPLGDCCLFLGNNYTFTYETTSPPPMPFEQLQHPPNTFMSNHVFYTYDDDWYFYLRAVKPHQPDVGVWEMLRAGKVYRSTDAVTRYPPLWIVPSISFPRLEELDSHS